MPSPVPFTAVGWERNSIPKWFRLPCDLSWSLFTYTLVVFFPPCITAKGENLFLVCIIYTCICMYARVCVQYTPCPSPVTVCGHWGNSNFHRINSILRPIYFRHSSTGKPIRVPRIHPSSSYTTDFGDKSYFTRRRRRFQKRKQNKNSVYIYVLS